ncbi:GGDEF domain-containing protein [Schlegelella sp. S2-27]|uniref:diguanylate cyclase n=1 Tax=Caldimonas mangrovi TaxID=2944811 RepID=A0ABT0YQF5_9BURK|nr:diguanylate cyclase [Caldimonas mangrovi]MCM5680554.1 GGDEF domain-containing protein [Caldimonas mangrovi]
MSVLRPPSDALAPHAGPAPQAGAAGDTPEASSRRKRGAQDQRNRLKMIGVSTVNYFAGSFGLALYAWAGSVGWHIPAWFFAVNTLGGLVFALLVVSGLNLRLRDPNMFMWQMLFAGVVLFGFLTAAPQLGFAFLSAMLVTGLFGLVQFTVVQFRVALAVAAAGAAIVFYWVGDQLRLPASNPTEVAVLWVYFVLVLARFTVLASHLNTLRRKLREKNELLQQSLQRIQELADRDELTGALSRRRLMQLIEAEISRSDRSGEPFCVVLLDLDHFKQINDTHGHLTGDEVLRRFCAAVKGTLRLTDQLGRYGGEEFVVLLPALPAAHAPGLMARLMQGIAERGWNDLAPGLDVTASGGIAAYRRGESVQSLLNRADEALYRAKRLGRNRVEYTFDAGADTAAHAPLAPLSAAG